MQTRILLGLHLPQHTQGFTTAPASGTTWAWPGHALRRPGNIVWKTKAHQQLQVSKSTDGAETETAVVALSKEQRVVELARLLGGDKVTDMAKANARELLAS